MKKKSHIVTPQEINSMRKDIDNSKIDFESALLSERFRRWLQKKIPYITGRDDIKLYLNTSTPTAYTDNEKIVVNPLMRIEVGREITFDERVAIITGLLLHEIFHVLFTDFTQLKKISKYKKRQTLLATVNNILEDSYIEHIGCAIYTGDARSSIMTIRGLCMEMADPIDKIPKDTNKLVAALSHYGSSGMVVGKFEPSLQAVWDKIEPLFDKGRVELNASKRFAYSEEITMLIEEIADKESAGDDFDKNPSPMHGDNMKSAASGKKMTKEEIEKLLEDIDIHELIKEAKKAAEKGFEEDERETSEGESDGLKIGIKTDNEDTTSEGDSMEKPDIIIDLTDSDDKEEEGESEDDEDGPIVIKPEHSEKKKEESEDSEDELATTKSGLNDEEAENEGETETESEVDAEDGEEFEGDDEKVSAGEDSELAISKREKALKEVKKLDIEAKENIAKLKSTLEKEIKEDMLDNAIENNKLNKMRSVSRKTDYGINHKHIHNITRSFISDSDYCVREYNNIASDLSDVIQITSRKMRKILQTSKAEVFTKQRVGRFNVRDVKEVFGEGKAFKRERDGSSVDIVFTVLVDESGSMNSGYNFINARKAAVVFNEICENLKIPVMVMGFTTEGADVVHNIYTNFETPGNKKYGIASISANDENRDSYSLRYAGEVMNHFYPEKKKVLLFISDGQPSHGRYGGREADKDIVKQRDILEKKYDTSVIAINISGREGLHAGTFKKIVEVPVFSELPDKIAQVLKKEFKKALH